MLVSVESDQVDKKELKRIKTSHVNEMYDKSKTKLV